MAIYAITFVYSSEMKKKTLILLLNELKFETWDVKLEFVNLERSSFYESHEFLNESRRELLRPY